MLPMQPYATCGASAILEYVIIVVGTWSLYISTTIKTLNTFRGWSKDARWRTSVMLKIDTWPNCSSELTNRHNLTRWRRLTLWTELATVAAKISPPDERDILSESFWTYFPVVSRFMCVHFCGCRFYMCLYICKLCSLFCYCFVAAIGRNKSMIIIIIVCLIIFRQHCRRANASLQITQVVDFGAVSCWRWTFGSKRSTV